MIDHPAASTAERDVFSPSQLTRLAHDTLEERFALIWIEGEISNFSRPASGHLYFGLKDAQAQVRCAMFKPKSTYLRFKPADGQRVLARARVSLYEARGEFQLIVEHLEPAGEGALLREFEQLKARLAKEGLFDARHKQALPVLPRRIGVITSPTGAAIRDVISVIGRRFPLVELEILPVPVQGKDAAAAIVAMLNAASKAQRHDVLLLTRGGGSLEDLWSFNDETLARAIHACTLPLVAAIGHEVDFTIAEFVADVRAPTPSAAAELLVPDGAAIAQRLRQDYVRLPQLAQRRMQVAAQRLDQAFARLRAQRPQARLRLGRERLDKLRERLPLQAARGLEQRKLALAQLAQRMQNAHPRTRLPPRRQSLAMLDQRLRSGTARRLEVRARHLSELARALNAVSPLATLQRGYAILIDRDSGHVLRSVTQVLDTAHVLARLADGEVALRCDAMIAEP